MHPRDKGVREAGEDGEDMEEEEVTMEVVVAVDEVVTMVEEGEDLVVTEVEEVDLKGVVAVRDEEDLEEGEEEGVTREEGAEVGKVQGGSKGTRGTLGLTRVKVGPREGKGEVIDLCTTSS